MAGARFVVLSLFVFNPVFAATLLRHGGITSKSQDDLKIKMLEVHFHPSELGMGTKPAEAHAAIEAFLTTYAAALRRHAEDESASWRALWATGDVTWYDPVGTAAYTSDAAMKARLAGIPPLSAVTVNEVFFSNDNQIFCAKLSATIANGPTLKFLDRFTVDDNMKIKKLEVHFHSSELGIGSKPVATHEAIEAFLTTYAAALRRHAEDESASWRALWATGDVTWYDPVGTPAITSDAAMKAQLAGIPPLSAVTVNEVFFSDDDKIFCAKLSATITNGPTVKFLDRFTLN